MSNQTPTPPSSIFAELKHHVMLLPSAQRLLLLAAVLLFCSTYANFIQGGDGSYYWMGGDESRWLVRALAVAFGWASLRWSRLTQQKTLATSGMWSAIALMAYGAYFAAEGITWVAGNVAASMAQARIGAMLLDTALGSAAKESGPMVDWMQGLRSALDDASGAIYPGVGGVMYVVACLILLKVTAKLSRELRA